MSETIYEVVIRREFCKGCGLCVEFCPEGKFFMRKKPDKRGVQLADVDPGTRCTGCRQCVMICPDAAVELYRLEAVAGDRSEGS